MTTETAMRYFIGTFTAVEREALLGNADFQHAVLHSTEDLADLKKLNTLGVKLLHSPEYRPTPSAGRGLA